MLPAAAPFPNLQVKGALQEGALYIERAADSELEGALLAGEYCYVLAPRQIGKSSLRLHAARALVARGLRCVHIDLTLVGGHDDHEPRHFRRGGDELAIMSQRGAVAPELRIRRRIGDRWKPRSACGVSPCAAGTFTGSPSLMYTPRA